MSSPSEEIKGQPNAVTAVMHVNQETIAATVKDLAWQIRRKNLCFLVRCLEIQNPNGSLDYSNALGDELTKAQKKIAAYVNFIKRYLSQLRDDVRKNEIELISHEILKATNDLSSIPMESFLPDSSILGLRVSCSDSKTSDQGDQHPSHLPCERDPSLPPSCEPHSSSPCASFEGEVSCTSSA